MENISWIFLLTTLAMASAWSLPFHPYAVPQRMRLVRFAYPPPYRVIPNHPQVQEQPTEDPEYPRPKRDHEDDYNPEHDHNHDNDDEQGHHDYNRPTNGVTGPVHTFVKTDKNANYKWGVRHHVGNKYA